LHYLFLLLCPRCFVRHLQRIRIANPTNGHVLFKFMGDFFSIHYFNTIGTHWFSLPIMVHSIKRFQLEWFSTFVWKYRNGDWLLVKRQQPIGRLPWRCCSDRCGIRPVWSKMVSENALLRCEALHWSHFVPFFLFFPSMHCIWSCFTWHVL
jgi:hypothetical protein